MQYFIKNASSQSRIMLASNSLSFQQSPAFGNILPAASIPGPRVPGGGTQFEGATGGSGPGNLTGNRGTGDLSQDEIQRGNISDEPCLTIEMTENITSACVWDQRNFLVVPISVYDSSAKSMKFSVATSTVIQSGSTSKSTTSYLEKSGVSAVVQYWVDAAKKDESGVVIEKKKGKARKLSVSNEVKRSLHYIPYFFALC
jgi:hypothetical protein